jgi:hypothetical protein
MRFGLEDPLQVSNQLAAWRAVHNGRILGVTSEALDIDVDPA